MHLVYALMGLDLGLNWLVEWVDIIEGMSIYTVGELGELNDMVSIEYSVPK